MRQKLSDKVGCNEQTFFFFLIKDALVGLHFSQFFTRVSGLTNSGSVLIERMCGGRLLKVCEVNKVGMTGREKS